MLDTFSVEWYKCTTPQKASCRNGQVPNTADDVTSAEMASQFVTKPDVSHSGKPGEMWAASCDPHLNGGFSVVRQESSGLVACLAFLSARFSFSVLPVFFDCVWRGDLSAMEFSFL